MGRKYNFSVELAAENDLENIEYNTDNASRELKVRLDKWLWAARFFKTRALARSAVESGKIFYDGQKANPSMEIEIGATVQIQQGKIERLVVIRGLSTRRRNSEDALELFEELPNGSENNDGSSDNSDYHKPWARVDNGQAPKKTARFLRRTFTRKGSNVIARTFSRSKDF